MHMDAHALACCQECRAESDVTDAASSDVQASEEVVVQGIFFGLSRECGLPYPNAIGRRREGEVHKKTQAPKESLVQQRFSIRCKYRKTAIVFHALQQIVDLNIGVTVLAVAHFASLAEKRIGLVEKQNGPPLPSRIHSHPKSIFPSANIFAHDTGAI